MAHRKLESCACTHPDEFPIGHGFPQERSIQAKARKELASTRLHNDHPTLDDGKSVPARGCSRVVVFDGHNPWDQHCDDAPCSCPVGSGRLIRRSTGIPLSDDISKLETSTRINDRPVRFHISSGMIGNGKINSTVYAVDNAKTIVFSCLNKTEAMWILLTVQSASQLSKGRHPSTPLKPA
jgi:hypothetical protein